MTAIDLPKRIRTLALAGQLVTLAAMLVILLYVTTTAYTAVLDGAIFDQMLAFYRDVIFNSPDMQALLMPVQPLGPGPGFYSQASRITVLLSDLSIDVLGFLALLWAGALFRGYGKGEIFTPSAANRLSNVGWCIMLLAPFSSLSEFITIKVLLAAEAAHSSRAAFDLSTQQLVGFVGLDDTDVYALVFGLLLVTAGRILLEAAKISEENQSFV